MPVRTHVSAAVCRPGRIRPALVLAVALALATTVLAAGAPAARPPQLTGGLAMQVWRLEELGAAPTNWGVVVHPATGFVYAANQNGVLEFDGVRWRLIPLPRGGAVRHVVVAPDGKVWAAGSGQICVLRPDADRGLRAEDMGRRLPEIAGAGGPEAGPTAVVADDGAEFPVPDTRQIGAAPVPVAGGDGIYFVLPGRIVRFRPDDGVDVWPKREASAVPGWWSDGGLHVVLGRRGIHRFAADGTSSFVGQGGPRVFTAVPQPGGGSVWLTANGPLRVGASRRRTPLASAEAVALFASDRARCALPLPDGGSAYGTINHGVVRLDAQGAVVHVLDRARGLPANRVNGLALDRDGGLWLAMHAGLVRVQYVTPLAVHGLAQGLSGSPWQAVMLGDAVVVSHSEGVAWRDPADGRFRNVPGISAAMQELRTAGDEVLVGGLGLYSVRPDAPARALGPAVYRYGVAYTPARPDAFFHYGPVDVQLWERERGGPPGAAGWKLRGSFGQLAGGADDVLDGGRYVWVVTRDTRVRRFDVGGGLELDPPARVFDIADGLPPLSRLDKVRLLPLGGDLLVVSKRGVWRHDPRSDRLEPEPRAGLAAQRIDAAVPTPRGAWLYSAEPRPVLREIVTGGDAAWSVTEHAVPELAGLNVHGLLQDEASRTLWITAQTALLSFDLNGRSGAAPGLLRATFRRVLTPAGDVLWQHPDYTRALEPAAPVFTLAPDERAVRVEFTAVSHHADFRGRRLLRFRTRAGGIDADWTPWTDEPHRDLTNLRDGTMRFELQARDLAGRESEVAQLAFQVLPPWWRTTAARAGGIVVGLAAIGGVIRLRTRSLRRRARELESVVAARTEELRLRNLELARLHQLEMDEKISARLAEEKAQLELLRYQLNPHFLLNAFTTLRSLVFSKPDAAGEMVARLASFCRLALTRSDEAGATVAEEAHLVETYLATEQARWRDDLRCSVEVDPAARERRLPPFLLQPLVENAVKYGGRTSPGTLEVRVAIRDDGAGGLDIEVANTGAWIEPAAGAARGESTGIGLENLRRRLRRYYPGAHHLGIQSQEGWVKLQLQLRPPA